jgi:hypothetical protein
MIERQPKRDAGTPIVTDDREPGVSASRHQPDDVIAPISRFV